MFSAVSSGLAGKVYGMMCIGVVERADKKWWSSSKRLYLETMYGLKGALDTL